MIYIVVLMTLLLSILLFGVHIYGVYHSFKAHIGWGIASIFCAPLAFTVGTAKLITKKNILIKKEKAA